MEGAVVALARYPVKGLSAESRDSISLTAGEGVPHDRVMAFARPGNIFDEAAPQPFPKKQFYMLARDEALAKLATRYDAASDKLQLGESAFALSTADGRAGAEAAIAEALALPPGEMPRLVRGGTHRFTDVSVVSETMMNAISLINLASVAALGAAASAEVDPVRFRGNVVFDGWPAWSELELEGREIGIGPARLKVLLRTKRCAATTVNPDTAVRDIPVPRILSKTFGHPDMGIYAEVLEGGTIRQGDAITLL
ncbi:MOSC domain-containing protein [Acuticoccus sp. MNP-M23]|uniref:MOSC domain-containing protein n=1 Tax=Acuticoccus sp. MNP-M23 TaxID=3072793 RepID=UPI002815BB77|nr:MOSC domain-containing protein [Acuticoccus sp. MNP-M23]WMS45015.1 MOSC domain-containing protein [Acuticoccus sp. MNP-M23]